MKIKIKNNKNVIEVKLNKLIVKYTKSNCDFLIGLSRNMEEDKYQKNIFLIKEIINLILINDDCV
jgi:hypothetical protein